MSEAAHQHGRPIHRERAAPSGRPLWSFAAALVLAWSLVACTDEPLPTVPRILSFVADPSSAKAGETVTLSWRVAGSDELLLGPGDIDVTGTASIVVTPDTTTTYTLVATNGFGSAQAAIIVSVEPPAGPLPVIVSFVTQEVNPGLATTLHWEVDGEERIVLLGPGLGDGVEVTSTTRRDVEDLPTGASYTLVASNEYGSTRREVVAARSVPAFSVLFAGQSNSVGENLDPYDALAFISAAANVRMLGNDYRWKAAYEPLDDCVGQAEFGDTVSMDPQPPKDCPTFNSNTSGVSAGVSLGNRLVDLTGGTAFLIPSGLSGSGLSSWLPLTHNYDRSRLFGSATYRARLAAQERGAPLGYEFNGSAYGAVVWYQGETDTASETVINSFATRTRTVLDTFRAELGAPTLLVQLSRRGPTGDRDDPDGVQRNLNYQRVREAQRLLATGARLPTSTGTVATGTLPRTYLVVTHDLPMPEGDGRHLSAEGQRELGRRLSLAIREHLLNEPGVDGSGPQLVRVEKLSNNIEIHIRTDRPIRPSSATGAGAYSGYFAVFADGSPVSISSIQRSDTDDHVVRIVLSQPVESAMEVRYMPPPGVITELAPDVIRSASCGADTIPDIPQTNLCLPMAAFGAVTGTAEQLALSLYVAPDEDE